MKNIAANLILALCAIVFSTSCGTGKVPEVGSAEAAAQLQKDLKGTYEELFSENTSLNPNGMPTGFRNAKRQWVQRPRNRQSKH